MSLSIHDPFKAPPTISKEGFITLLKEKNSPFVGEAPQIYDAIVAYNHDPGRWLGICWKEHQFGTDRNSVIARNDTKSWTNARTVRHPDIKKTATIIVDSVRKSQYVKYASVLDSVLDGLYRVEEPGYAYAGKKSILEIIDVWAPASDNNKPQGYAQTIVDLIKTWSARFPYKESPTMSAQIAGFAWRPAASTHFQKGRTAAIRGGAQHYTAGTSSLDWLTHTSRPAVSSTFLVKRNATMNDRGWQLVRIEDTPWTTAFANPYTVSIELEHQAHQSISDEVYEVLAQTWADITKYVEQNNLGAIEVVRGHKEWVNNPGLICPDGIDVARIERRRKELLVSTPTPTPQPEEPTWRYFPETGHYINFGFRGFWESYGDKALPTFGYPISEEMEDVDGVTVQWFERARFEFRPEIADNPQGVVLGLVGSELLEQDRLTNPEAFERMPAPEE